MFLRQISNANLVRFIYDEYAIWCAFESSKFTSMPFIQSIFKPIKNNIAIHAWLHNKEYNAEKNVEILKINNKQHVLTNANYVLTVNTITIIFTPAGFVLEGERILLLLKLFYDIMEVVLKNTEIDLQFFLN